ncbi:hypothetical protein JZ751_024872 [Albula glossodonta]|uniref:Uncharacterized protein n=1 Tax=Albula glossodonta TaxID=121402 RepID=A0A8T2PC74_9TELE|nr:hypothetical protein JZ751_024872 [Albula glossodonta]
MCVCMCVCGQRRLTGPRADKDRRRAREAVMVDGRVVMDAAVLWASLRQGRLTAGTEVRRTPSYARAPPTQQHRTLTQFPQGIEGESDTGNIKQSHDTGFLCPRASTWGRSSPPHECPSDTDVPLVCAHESSTDVPLVCAHASSTDIPLVCTHGSSTSVPLVCTHGSSTDVPLVCTHGSSTSVPLVCTHGSSTDVALFCAHGCSTDVPLVCTPGSSTDVPLVCTHGYSTDVPLVCAHVSSTDVPLVCAHCTTHSPVTLSVREAGKMNESSVQPPPSPPISCTDTQRKNCGV